MWGNNKSCDSKIGCTRTSRPKKGEENKLYKITVIVRQTYVELENSNIIAQHRETAQNHRKSPLLLLCNFSSFHFQFSTFPFSTFRLFCSILSFFLTFIFPIGQQQFPGQKSGSTVPPCPPPVTPLTKNSYKLASTICHNG